MKKLTPSLKKKITRDWEQAFPDLVVYKNMWLLRRLGPFVQGICLDTDSSNANYLPTFHIHNLASQDDDFISLTLRTPLVSNRNGAVQHITLSQHEQALAEYQVQFREQAPFSLDTEVSCDEIWHAYKKYIEQGQEETRYPLNQYFDMVCLLIWCKRLSEALAFFDQCCREIESWPEQATRYITDRVNGFYALKNDIADPRRIQQKVEKATLTLGLEHKPSTELTA